MKTSSPYMWLSVIVASITKVLWDNKEPKEETNKDNGNVVTLVVKEEIIGRKKHDAKEST